MTTRSIARKPAIRRRVTPDDPLTSTRDTTTRQVAGIGRHCEAAMHDALTAQCELNTMLVQRVLAADARVLELERTVRLLARGVLDLNGRVEKGAER